MTTKTEETRSWTQLANDKIYLQEQLDQVRLEQAEDKTRVYQTTGDGVAETLKEFGEWMWWAGTHCDPGGNALWLSDEEVAKKISDAIEEWKESQ